MTSTNPFSNIIASYRDFEIVAPKPTTTRSVMSYRSYFVRPKSFTMGHHTASMLMGYDKAKKFISAYRDRAEDNESRTR